MNKLRVVDLKKLAKNRGLKGYSGLKKANLIRFIQNRIEVAPAKAPAPSVNLSKMRVVNLRKVAKNRGLKGYSGLKKANLIRFIQKQNQKSPSPPTNTRVYRCVEKLRQKMPLGKAIAICQKSTKQKYSNIGNAPAPAPTQKLVKNKKNNKIKMSLFDVSKGVLLAKEYKDDIDPTGMLASEKYDGVRAIWDGKNLRSRNDKIFYAPQWFLDMLPKNYPLDGELFLKRGSFEATFSIVSKKVPIDEEWKRIKYVVFDLPNSDQIFVNRLVDLQNIVRQTCHQIPKCPIEFAEHVVIKSKNHMKQMFQNIVSQGGEGIMLRDPKSLYQQKRTKNLLKVKPTDDAEAVIENMVEGQGKDSGRMGALKVHLAKNPSIKFKIGSGFTDKLRQDFWNKKEHYIGNEVTFGYKGLTAKGVPRHPVFIRKKLDKAY